MNGKTDRQTTVISEDLPFTGDQYEKEEDVEYVISKKVKLALVIVINLCLLYFSGRHVYIWLHF